jgi:hypothetical protein
MLPAHVRHPWGSRQSPYKGGVSPKQKEATPCEVASIDRDVI